jgi:hypothetical protein
MLGEASPAMEAADARGWPHSFVREAIVAMHQATWLETVAHWVSSHRQERR